MKNKTTKFEMVVIIAYLVCMSWFLEAGLFAVIGQMNMTEAVQQVVSLNVLFLYLAIFCGIVIGILYKLGIWQQLFDDGEIIQ